MPATSYACLIPIYLIKWKGVLGPELVPGGTQYLQISHRTGSRGNSAADIDTTKKLYPK